VPAPYLDCLREAEATAVLVSPGEPAGPEELLEPFDGLLLIGGGDVDPARYGQERSQHVYGVEPDRDELEIALLHAADRMRVPTLCICRGMQVMNVAFGGTLHQHLPEVPGLMQHGQPVEGTQTMHAVTPSPASRLSAVTKSGPLRCSSHHHQGVDRLGDGLAVTGVGDDGLVEAIERIVEPPVAETDPWMLGVQWHPEDTSGDDPAQRSLFQALALLARLRGSRARPRGRGGRSRAYEISEPDPAWPRRFEAEASTIRESLGGLATRIDHVGSTSVPGVPAKDVVDIQVSVASMVPRAAYVERG
jgi:putative glutamine amidotransferase